MRTAKLIITTLLALQLFVTAGLCGGACCATDPELANRDDPAAEENYKPATEEKIEGGNCPMHAAKQASPAPRERKQYSMKTTQRPGIERRRDHQAKSSSTSGAHFCGCTVRRDERSFDAALQKSPELRPAPQILSGDTNVMRWLMGTSPPLISSPDSLLIHSPPFNGRQLHLRI